MKQWTGKCLISTAMIKNKFFEAILDKEYILSLVIKYCNPLQAIPIVVKYNLQTNSKKTNLSITKINTPDFQKQRVKSFIVSIWSLIALAQCIYNWKNISEKHSETYKVDILLGFLNFATLAGLSSFCHLLRHKDAELVSYLNGLLNFRRVHSSNSKKNPENVYNGNDRLVIHSSSCVEYLYVPNMLYSRIALDKSLQAVTNWIFTAGKMSLSHELVDDQPSFGENGSRNIPFVFQYGPLVFHRLRWIVSFVDRI